MKPQEMTFTQLTLESNKVAMIKMAIQHLGDHVCPSLHMAIDAVVDRDYLMSLPEADREAYYELTVAMSPELIEAQKILSHFIDLKEAIDEWDTALHEEWDNRKAAGVEPFEVENAWNESNGDTIQQAMSHHLGFSLMVKSKFLERFYGE